MITVGVIMVAIAILAYVVVKRKNRRTKLKWQIEDMYGGG